eukprot:Clim_evm51s243 gene=Clim_evmTU51s243
MTGNSGDRRKGQQPQENGTYKSEKEPTVLKGKTKYKRTKSRNRSVDYTGDSIGNPVAQDTSGRYIANGNQDSLDTVVIASIVFGSVFLLLGLLYTLGLFTPGRNRSRYGRSHDEEDDDFNVHQEHEDESVPGVASIGLRAGLLSRSDYFAGLRQRKQVKREEEGAKIREQARSSATSEQRKKQESVLSIENGESESHTTEKGEVSDSGIETTAVVKVKTEDTDTLNSLATNMTDNNETDRNKLNGAKEETKGTSRGPGTGYSLAEILEAGDYPEELEKEIEKHLQDELLSHNREATKDGNPLCIECDDQPARVFCHDCGDLLCEVCFYSLHRRGKRREHRIRVLRGLDESEKASELKAATAPANTETVAPPADDKEGDGVEATADQLVEQINADQVGDRHIDDDEVMYAESHDGNWFRERSKYIPLRLTLQERKFLRLLEAALNVSEYTDKVDIISYKSKNKRIYAQLMDICAILSGLLVASDYNQGVELVKDKDFRENAEFFQMVFEVGRRYKILNPEKMRNDYGKLIYLLMDSQKQEIQDLLGFQLVTDIQTVYRLMKGHDCDDFFDDPLISVATAEILAPRGVPRYEIQRKIKAKERAIEKLAHKYSRNGLTGDDVRRALYSIADNHSFLNQARRPVDLMLELLERYYHPDREPEDPKHALAIYAGRQGARLTHDHARQYWFVKQSLMLWRDVAHEMFMLWFTAENDLLASNYHQQYRLLDTGQGFQRVQPAPQTSRAMHILVQHAQRKLGHWVGSSVIHMGDHNVPNALIFIDKYTQIPRVLGPVVQAIDYIPELMKDSFLAEYIDQRFGGPDNLRMTILGDFCRHAFDGSGASNYFDAGSCIDGRLTSAWNWCSKLEKKSFFPIFLLSGFIGFDGKFGE